MLLTETSHGYWWSSNSYLIRYPPNRNSRNNLEIMQQLGSHHSNDSARIRELFISLTCRRIELLHDWLVPFVPYPRWTFDLNCFGFEILATCEVMKWKRNCCVLRRSQQPLTDLKFESYWGFALEFDDCTRLVCLWLRMKICTRLWCYYEQTDELSGSIEGFNGMTQPDELDHTPFYTRDHRYV